MEPNGFFTLTLGKPGQATPATETPGWSLRLGWLDGEPYLLDMGSAGKVLVNGTPIEPNQPVCLQTGDSITIGDARLTWSTGPETGQAAKATAVFTRQTLELEKLEIAEEPAPYKSDETKAEPSDAAVIFPKRVAEQVRAQAQDPTLLRPKTPIDPAAPGHPDPTLLAPKPPGQLSQPEQPDPTLLAPKPPSQLSQPEQPDPTLLAPETPSQPVDPDPSGRAPVAPDDTGIYKTAWVDMAQLAEEESELAFESTTILRDTGIPHLVLHTANRTWEVQLNQDSATIGRSKGNDIPILDDSVSQHHALIERLGDGFVVRDVGSSNGLWLGKQRVEEHRLNNGDVLSLGRAKLVFKGGFTSDDLTLIGPPRIDGKPARRPVVFVPGLMGTELWLGSERLWPDIRTIISRPEVFALPGDPRIETRGIVNEVVVVPHVIESRQYSAMGDYLVSSLGYTRGKDLLEFGYDWRHDIRLAAQRLAEAIEGWGVGAPITIIAHSLGTMVTRYYVERLGGKRTVERIILMGGPHYGTPKTMAAILTGPGMLPFGMADERMRKVLSTFPTAYQILPIYPCVTDQNDNQIDVLKDESWLEEHQRPYLSATRSFRRELGLVSSVPTVSVFGYGLKTKLRMKVERRSDGSWQKYEFIEDAAGDQSVPSASAVLKDSEIHPVLQEHGSLYVDDDVRMRLKVELTRSTTWQGGK